MLALLDLGGWTPLVSVRLSLRWIATVRRNALLLASPIQFRLCGTQDRHARAIPLYFYHRVVELWGGLGCLELTRWAGWYGDQVGRCVKC